MVVSKIDVDQQWDTIRRSLTRNLFSIGSALRLLVLLPNGCVNRRRIDTIRASSEESSRLLSIGNVRFNIQPVKIQLYISLREHEAVKHESIYSCHGALGQTTSFITQRRFRQFALTEEVLTRHCSSHISLHMVHDKDHRKRPTQCT
jgi:hypothetical protein